MGVAGLIRDHYLKSRVEWALENYPEFIPIETLRERIGSLEPDRVLTAARMIGHWHECEGRLEDAESAYAWGMQLWRTDPSWPFESIPLDFADCLQRVGKKSEAKAVRDEFADRCEDTRCYGDPTLAGVWLGQLGMQCRSEDTAESITYYERAVAIFAAHKRARATAAGVMEDFAEVLRDAGAHERADEMLKRAQKLRPKRIPKKAKPKL